MNYYPHHIGDYAMATAHLSWDEDMAYSRLLRAYYHHEKPIPADPVAAARLIRAGTAKQREAMEAVLKEFFVLEADGWHQKRCDEEIALLKDKSEKARRSAEVRWSQNDGSADGMRTHSEGNALHTPSSNNQTQTPKKRGRRVNGARTTLPDEFPLTDSLIAYAARQGIRSRKVVERFHERFVLQHRSKGYTNVDHVATWQTWLRKDIDEGRIRTEPKPVVSDT